MKITKFMLALIKIVKHTGLAQLSIKLTRLSIEYKLNYKQIII